MRPASMFFVNNLLLVLIACGLAEGNTTQPTQTEQLSKLETSGEEIFLRPDGSIDRIQIKDKEHQSIAFRNDSRRTGLTIQNDPYEERKPLNPEKSPAGISASISPSIIDDTLCLTASVSNEGDRGFQPTSLSLCLGIDCYMEKYPQWNRVMFPTLIRTERTHSWGYFMSPEGGILVFASPDPLAGWANDYEQSQRKIGDFKGYYGAHRIRTSFLDLMHRLPLPARHPQHLYSLDPGKTLTTRIFLKPVKEPAQIKPLVSRLTKAAILDSKQYTLAEGREFSGTVHHINSRIARMEIRSPRNEIFTITPAPTEERGVSKWNFTPESGYGLYLCTITTTEGKTSEASLYVRPSYEFYLAQARKEALRSQPTSTHHAECFYPLYTYFLARKFIPDPEIDQQAEAVFNRIFPELFDGENKVMRADYKQRIQDAATMAGVLTDRYQVTGNEDDLRNASALVDFLIASQKEDGAYYNLNHNTHYTSVIYIAKSIMEVMAKEKKLAQTDNRWKESYERHLASVRRAIDNLREKGDNIETEGQMTFEDGMISCSILQLAMAALKETDEDRRTLYTQRALELDRKHRCLTQLLIPDCRMNGATLRFWEYQYTVNLMANGINSPCGWSNWKTYATWYLYLLTGDVTYLEQTFNALGSCLQLLDAHTGELRFSFLPDPYIDTCQYMELPAGSGKPVPRRIIVGEQYISQTSNWHKKPNATWRQKWGIDNFVHETFKCISEIALCNAYIVEMPDGTIRGFNCNVTKNGNELIVTTNERLVSRLHVNLKGNYTISAPFTGKDKFTNISGMRWLGSSPEELEPF